METPSDDKFRFRDIPGPVFKGFLERFKAHYNSYVTNGFGNVPCHFSSNQGTRTWELDYYTGNETRWGGTPILIAKEYDNSPVNHLGYKLDCPNGVETEFTIRTGEMKLLRELKYSCDIAVSGEVQWNVRLGRHTLA